MLSFFCAKLSLAACRSYSAASQLVGISPGSTNPAVSGLIPQHSRSHRSLRLRRPGARTAHCPSIACAQGTMTSVSLSLPKTMSFPARAREQEPENALPAQSAAQAGTCRPRTTRPGSAPVGSPLWYVTAPDTIVAS